MDRVTKSYLNSFVESYGLAGNESELFEHFVNYTLIEGFSYDRFDIEILNIGKGGTLGIDGFAVIVNGNVISSEDDLNKIIETHNQPESDVVFIQSKTSPSFELNDIGNFGWAVKDFISEAPKIAWDEDTREKISLFNKLVSYTSKLKEKPRCHLFYVTLGKIEENKNREAKKLDIVHDLKSENVFSENIAFSFIGANELQEKYKKIGISYSSTFEFQKRVTLPVIENIPESYLGIIPASTLINIISDDNGNIIPEIFYDNVRDFQGANKVNREIAQTLNDSSGGMFVAMNNGVTIIAEKITTSRDEFSIEGYQIINGCQTSNVLHENKDNVTENVYIPIRLIATKSQDAMSKIIRATNRQTEVKEQDLIAFTDFQKKLEDFYNSIEINYRLYYERRAKQYNKSNIEKKRIIDKTVQIKAFASYFFDKPNMATRYFGTLFNEFGDKLFKDGHNYNAYYMVGYILYNIEESFRRNDIDRKYRKVKFFILMMLKYEIHKELDLEKCPIIESKKMDSYCNDVLRLVYSDQKFSTLIGKIENKFNAINSDFSDRDISKSTSFLNECLQHYNQR